MEENKNILKVELTTTHKEVSYSGTIGQLIGNTLAMLQTIYRSLKNGKNRSIFKREITKYVQAGVVFMSNDDIQKTLDVLSVEGGDKNE